MARVIFIQGRELKTSEIEWIRGLLQVHPEWNRIRLSRELCGGWYWRNLAGWPKRHGRVHAAAQDRAGLLHRVARPAEASVNARRNLYIG